MKIKQTGIEQLDVDIQKLFSLDNPDQIKQLDMQNERCETSLDDILSICGVSALRVASLLASDRNYKLLVKNCNKDSIETLGYAREFVQMHMQKIVSSSHVQQLLVSLQGKTFSPFADSLNTINRVSARSNWIVSDDEIIPAIRFVFSNNRSEKVLLQSTMDWDDDLFLSERLLAFLDDDMKMTHTILNKRSQKKIAIDQHDLLERVKAIKEHAIAIEEYLKAITAPERRSDT